MFYLRVTPFQFRHTRYVEAGLCVRPRSQNPLKYVHVLFKFNLGNQAYPNAGAYVWKSRGFVSRNSFLLSRLNSRESVVYTQYYRMDNEGAQSYSVIIYRTSESSVSINW